VGDTVRGIDTVIAGLIAEKLQVSEQRVVPAARLEQDLGADSLARVELLLLLEEEFQIDIPDEEAAEITTVQELIDYIAIYAPGGASHDRARRPHHHP
jgi:acyl carrier protein